MWWEDPGMVIFVALACFALAVLIKQLIDSLTK